MPREMEEHETMPERNPEKPDDFIEIENPFFPNDAESRDGFYHEELIVKVKKLLEKKERNKLIIIQGAAGIGKSMTLKLLEEHPQRIGNSHVITRIDTRSYLASGISDWFAFLFQTVALKIERLGYQIPFVRCPENAKVEALLQAIEESVPEKYNLLLVLDELDTLIENLDISVISLFVRTLRRIEKSWKRYTLILVGDKKLLNLVDAPDLNKVLRKAAVIDMEEKKIEKAIINRLIVEPLEDRVRFQKDAISKIIWYSGKHLHCLHLICYYLINYLNKMEDTQCTKRYVENTIKRILKEARPEFDFAWAQMSFEQRLIASALADETVTKQIQRFYYLEKEGLLSDIFSEGIGDKIKRLRGYSVVNEIEGNRFDGYPFKVPLYGKWIQKKHPFLKTVIDHIDFVADKVDLERLKNTIDENPTKKSIVSNRNDVLLLIKHWTELKNIVQYKRKIASKKKLASFLNVLSRLIGFKSKEEVKNTPISSFILDIRSLNIGVLDEGYLFIQDRPELTDEYIGYIENTSTAMARDVSTRLAIFLYIHKIDKVEALVKRPYLNLVPIDEHTLKKIILSDNPYHTFKQNILKKISLKKVSPYHTSGLAKSVFYGRSDTIQQIINASDKNFSIVGARKIGKSSLLHKIKEQLPPRTYCIFLNLEGEFSDVKDYNVFLTGLSQEIQSTFKQVVDFDNDVSRIPGVIRELSSGGKKKIVFILDEVDELIKFDKKRDYKLIRTFRKITQADHCRLIVAGFKTLYHGKREHESPFYNFCEEILLEHLEPEAALDLITKPMTNIGAHYDKSECTSLILDYTARHPNLLQFFGKNLIEIIEKHQNIDDRRTVFSNDIEEVLGSRYEDYIIDDIYMFFSDLEDIDKLIVILLVEGYPDRKAVTISLVKRKLGEAGIKIPINEVTKRMQELVMRFFLLNCGRGNYCFALPIFPDILKKRIDEEFKIDLIKDIKDREVSKYA